MISTRFLTPQSDPADFRRKLLNAPEPHHHIVQFYNGDDHLLQVVADFLAAGLRAGEPLAVIATEAHRGAFRGELVARGFDVDGACASGQLTLLDARTMLGTFMVGGMPDWDAFVRRVGGALEKISGHFPGRQVRAYGEMVDLLWRNEQRTAAIRLEEFWNELGKSHSFSLLCAYVMGNFYRDGDRQQFQHICRTHSHVLPAESHADSEEPAERLREISLLQQRALALETELRDRKELEEALRVAFEARRRAEDEVRQSQKELQAFVESAAEGLHWVGADGKVLWANQAELDLLGYSREEFIGKHISDFHVDQPLIQDILGRLGRNETLRNYEARLRAKDGSIKQVLINSNVLWRDGKFIHTQCFTRDITDRAEAERNLRDSQRALATLADISEAFAEAGFNLERIFDAITRKVVEILGDACLVRLLSEDGCFLKTVGAYHRDADALVLMKEIASEPSPSTEGLTGKVMQTGKSVLVTEMDPKRFVGTIGAAGRSYAERFPMYSLVAVPITADGHTIGVLAATRHSPNRPYSENDRALLEELSYRAALAIRSARQHQQLQEQRQRLDAVLRQMPSAVAIVEAPSGKVILANEQNEAIFRQRNVPMSGIPEYRRFSGLRPDGREIQPHEWPLSRSITTGEVVKGEEIHIVRGDGTHGAIRVNSAPVRDKGGIIVAGVVTFDDVSERKQAEEQRTFLLEASTLLASTLDYSKTLTAVAQLAVPKIADWCAVEIGDDPATSSQVAAAHVDPAKLESAFELRRRYPPDRNAPTGVPNVLRTGKPELVPEIPVALLESAARDAEHLRLIRELGLKSYMVVPLIARERVLGAITFISAESGHRYGPKDLAFAEELANCAALAIENARLYEDQLRRSEFEQQVVGIVSHDLRNPISAIGMSAALLLRRGELNEQQGKAVGRIVSSTERAQRMIRDFLDFTQARLGDGIPVSCQPLDFHELTQTVVDDIHLSHPEREVVLKRNGEGEGVWDSDRLAQVIGNLVTNAFQHSPPASPIQVATRGSESTVELEVANDGPPIPADQLGELFLPFKRGREPKERPTGSIGLGLYIARQLVLAHRGTLDVRSTEREGTVFTVRLPRHPGAAG